MKSMVYWLMGDRAGRVVTASWNWAWGKSQWLRAEK
jgi:phage shock protein A